MIRGGKISKPAGIVLGVASALCAEPLAVIYHKYFRTGNRFAPWGVSLLQPHRVSQDACSPHAMS